MKVLFKPLVLTLLWIVAACNNKVAFTEKSNQDINPKFLSSMIVVDNNNIETEVGNSINFSIKLNDSNMFVQSDNKAVQYEVELLDQNGQIPKWLNIVGNKKILTRLASTWDLKFAPTEEINGVLYIKVTRQNITTKQDVEVTFSAYDIDHKTVAELNKQFNITKLKCDDGRPAYFCSGIIIHSFDSRSLSGNDKLSISNNNQESICDLTGEIGDAWWCPNTVGIDKGAISFSFLRQDITHPGSITDPIWHYKEGGAGVGYIFDLNLTKKIDVYCSFVQNADTNDRKGFSGCGDLVPSHSSASIYYQYNPLNQANYSTCEKYLSPFTVTKYFDTYGNPPDSTDQCSISSANFDMFLQLSQQMNINETVYAGNNELLLSSWQGMNYNEVPIKAFFYVINSYAYGTRQKEYPDIAKTYAKLYNSYTNKNVPVVAIDMSILIKSKELTNPRPFIPSITAD